MVTIDVEGHAGDSPVERLIYGVMPDGTKYGIDMIMDILDSYGIKGIFFVDMAEAWDYGEEKISEVMQRIKDRKHTIGVHIHPDHMADRKRLFLHEYSDEEQTELICKCTELYEKLLGEKPKAFRAGKYSANWTTLNILGDLGYIVDFSEFYGQKWCGIHPACTCTTAIKLKNGIIEVPVSSFKSFQCFQYERFDKIDIEMPYGEFKEIITKSLLSDMMDPIIMFLHSFSFLNWRRTPNSPKANEHNIKKCKKMLDFLVKKVNFIGLNECISFYGNYDFIQKKNVLYEYLEMDGIKTYLYLTYRAGKVLKSQIDIKLRK